MSSVSPRAAENVSSSAPGPELRDMWLLDLLERLTERLPTGGGSLLQPRLRPVFTQLCPAVVAGYAVLAAAGSATCLAAARLRCRRGAPPAAGRGPLVTLLAACLTYSLLVLPLTLTALLLQNWVLGGTMCFMLPIMQVSWPEHPPSSNSLFHADIDSQPLLNLHLL